MKSYAGNPLFLDKDKLGNQLFVLAPEIIESLSEEEVESTYKDMQVLGIDEPPYDKFAVQFYPFKHIETMGYTVHTGEELKEKNIKGVPIDELINTVQTVYYYNKEPVAFSTYVPGISKSPVMKIRDDHRYKPSFFKLLRILLVLLVTNNVEKYSKENKLRSLGIGKSKKNFNWITTIKIGTNIIESSDGAAKGSEKRPHLRRGHIRRQHHGPGNSLIKMIFVQPTFIHADKEWIGERTAYNFHLSDKVH